MNDKFHTLTLLALVVLLASANQANATAYELTILGMSGVDSAAYAINNSGQVAGMNNYRATVWNGTTATDLGSGYVFAISNNGQMVGQSNGYATLWNGTSTTNLGVAYATAINNTGQVSGWSSAPDFGNAYYSVHTVHATIWNGTTATDLGTLGGMSSYATAINDKGQVAGWSYLTGNGTTLTDLGTLGGATSEANAMNNDGQVAGKSFIVGDRAEHATLWSGTTATDLGTLGGDFSEAKAINNVGQMAGKSLIAGNGNWHAALWNGTTITDLNSFLDVSVVNAGWVLNEAYKINDNGWIVGNASNHLLGISSNAFLMSVAAVPEPETYTIFLAGLCLIGFMARRKKLKDDMA